MDSDYGLSLGEGPPAGPQALVDTFQRTVRAHYREQGRDLPWRRTYDPYFILVSEVMLQQTQVARVLPKYGQFLAAYPSVLSLAGAPVADVLSVWQGLGYNRRALALHRAAQSIVSDHAGTIPCSPAELRVLPGVGPATAAAVCVFAYHLPVPFIETNIRSAFIHFFFQECVSVSDAEIMPLVVASLDRHNPRDWYYALMDYGAWVKKTSQNPGRRSAHHAVQSTFAGSRRQARAMVLRTLLAAKPSAMTLGEIRRAVPLSGEQSAEIDDVLADLCLEGFLRHDETGYRIA